LLVLCCIRLIFFKDFQTIGATGPAAAGCGLREPARILPRPTHSLANYNLLHRRARTVYQPRRLLFEWQSFVCGTKLLYQVLKPARRLARRPAVHHAPGGLRRTASPGSLDTQGATTGPDMQAPAANGSEAQADVLIGPGAPEPPPHPISLQMSVHWLGPGAGTAACIASTGRKFRRQYDQRVPQRTSTWHAVRRHRGIPPDFPTPPPRCRHTAHAGGGGGAPGVTAEAPPTGGVGGSNRFSNFKDATLAPPSDCEPLTRTGWEVSSATTST
jgi:hypothetical protein